MQKKKKIVSLKHFKLSSGQEQPPEVFFKKDALKIFTYFTAKHLCWSLFSLKCIKKRLQHRCFPVKFEKFCEEHMRTTASIWGTTLNVRSKFFVIKVFTIAVRCNMCFHFLEFHFKFCKNHHTKVGETSFKNIVVLGVIRLIFTY